MVSDDDTLPQNDIVAIFHASFHATQGNTIDWSLTIDNSIPLHNLEFNALPSGLHLVDQDVVYFTKHGHSGICIYKRRPSSLAARGFSMSSLGILVAKSKRPRPWRHKNALIDLIMVTFTKMELRGAHEPAGLDWDPARAFFDKHKLRPGQQPNVWGEWKGWSAELDSSLSDPSLPIFHLSHMLRILGPSSLTIYKHALGRRRILIFTLPPVEAACILCHVLADLVLDYQLSNTSGRTRESLNVLGMITLNDFDTLRDEGKNGRGWIACTTDALFLERPECYDLLVDLTSCTPIKATRPTLSISQPILPIPSRGPKFKLVTIRFVWSDIRLWNELDRILKRDATGGHASCSCVSPQTYPENNSLKSRSVSTWTDAWRVYEDVCLICAGLWIGSWRGNSISSYSATNEAGWGSVRLEGDDDLTINASRGGGIRNVGRGIEGRPGSHGSGGGSEDDTDLPSSSVATTASPPLLSLSKGMKKTAPMSLSTIHSTASESGTTEHPDAITPPPSQASSSNAQTQSPDDVRDRQILTTLALLQTFHAHACFQLDTLGRLIAKSPSSSANQYAFGDLSTVVLTAKDVLLFELGPLCSLDARYLGWLAEEYAPRSKLVIKTGWRDLVGILFGY